MKFVLRVKEKREVLELLDELDIHLAEQEVIAELRRKSMHPRELLAATLEAN